MPYGVAKSGIIGLTRSMALELADYGITANAIAPGPIDTEMVRAAWSKEALEERANHLSIRRLCKTEEIAGVALFLAAPESSYISERPWWSTEDRSRRAPTWSKSIVAARPVRDENRSGPNSFVGRERGTRELPSHGGCERTELT
jgi:hypothetical protein